MFLNAYIDHTVLKPTLLLSEVETCCHEAVENGFAAVCVPPFFVAPAARCLAGRRVKLATVIGFPFGYSAVEAKIAEAKKAIVDGADELDIVVNIAAIKNGDWAYLEDEIRRLMPVIKVQEGKVVKIIIESGVLTDDEIIQCCTLYGPLMTGIDYLKTSTGYAAVGATVAVVRLMRQRLPAVVGIKASGGIRDYALARSMIEAGATRLGCSASLAIVQGAADKGAAY